MSEGATKPTTLDLKKRRSETKTNTVTRCWYYHIHTHTRTHFSYQPESCEIAVMDFKHALLLSFARNISRNYTLF